MRTYLTTCLAESFEKNHGGPLLKSGYPSSINGASGVVTGNLSLTTEYGESIAVGVTLIFDGDQSPAMIVNPYANVDKSVKPRPDLDEATLKLCESLNNAGHMMVKNLCGVST